MSSCWIILGIEQTSDIKTIKQAYAQGLKRYHPEEEPLKFQELQKAYQEALAFAKSWKKNQASRQEANLDLSLTKKKQEIQDPGASSSVEDTSLVIPKREEGDSSQDQDVSGLDQQNGRESSVSYQLESNQDEKGLAFIHGQQLDQTERFVADSLSGSQDPPVSGLDLAGTGQAPVSGLDLEGSDQTPVSGLDLEGPDQTPVSGHELEGPDQTPVSGHELEGSRQAPVTGLELEGSRQAPVTGLDLEGSRQTPVSGLDLEGSRQAPVSGLDLEGPDQTPVSGLDLEGPDQDPVSGLDIEGPPLDPKTKLDLDLTPELSGETSFHEELEGGEELRQDAFAGQEEPVFQQTFHFSQPEDILAENVYWDQAPSSLVAEDFFRHSTQEWMASPTAWKKVESQDQLRIWLHLLVSQMQGNLDYQTIIDLPHMKAFRKQLIRFNLMQEFDFMLISLNILDKRFYTLSQKTIQDLQKWGLLYLASKLKPYADKKVAPIIEKTWTVQDRLAQRKWKILTGLLVSFLFILITVSYFRMTQQHSQEEFSHDIEVYKAISTYLSSSSQEELNSIHLPLKYEVKGQTELRQVSTADYQLYVDGQLTLDHIDRVQPSASGTVFYKDGSSYYLTDYGYIHSPATVFYPAREEGKESFDYVVLNKYDSKEASKRWEIYKVDEELTYVTTFNRIEIFPRQAKEQGLIVDFKKETLTPIQ